MLLSQLLGTLSPSSGWTQAVQPFSLPPYVRLLLADVDAGSDTPSLVGQVLKWRSEQPILSACKIPLCRLSIGLLTRLVVNYHYSNKVVNTGMKLSGRTSKLLSASKISASLPIRTQLHTWRHFKSSLSPHLTPRSLPQLPSGSCSRPAQHWQ